MARDTQSLLAANIKDLTSPSDAAVGKEKLQLFRIHISKPYTSIQNVTLGKREATACFLFFWFFQVYPAV